MREKTSLRLPPGLRSPEAIQRFLDGLPYNKEKRGETARSPRRVLETGEAHCFEGALFGAAALRRLGYRPLVVQLRAVRDDDHVLALFRERPGRGDWGAVAKSNYSGLRFRSPVYRTLRELAMSYFDIYFNMRRERTLRTYSRPVNLGRFDHLDWMTTKKPVWFIPYHLVDIPHTKLLRPGMKRLLHRVDDRLFRAETLGKAHKPSD